MSTKQLFQGDTQEVEQFLKSSSPFEKLQKLQAALQTPDALNTPKAIADVVSDAQALHQQARETPAQIAAVQPAREEQAVGREPVLYKDQMSVALPESEPRSVGRPLHGKKPKVEKTFAMDHDIHRLLVRISNHEGIRHDKKFSVSHIMNHLLAYALSHADGTNVIPHEDGRGLVIRSSGEQQ